MLVTFIIGVVFFILSFLLSVLVALGTIFKNVGATSFGIIPVYLICSPAALFALFFPSWTKLPMANFMSIHSFTIHILLALYPIMLTVGGDIRPRAKYIWKCLLLLICMAIPVYVFNEFAGTNYMFLAKADKGNPLYWFEQNWGNHLLGFPVILAAVVFVMYVPLELFRKLKKKLSSPAPAEKAESIPVNSNAK